MAILKIRIENAKVKIPVISKIKLSAIPIILSDADNKTKETIRGYLLSKRETSHPEIGSPIRELTGITIRRFPNSASFKSKAILIFGMREAQVEKQKPERKK
jgi:hypothetical protein